MEAFMSFLISFGLIFVAELGDKTQLMTISFASRYPRKTIFLGALFGMCFITALGVVIGVALYEVLPIDLVKIISAGIFIFFGLWILLKKEEEVETKKIPEKKLLLQTFLLFSIAELGDKTQLAVIALTATSGAPIAVLLGAILGFTLIILIGVLIGREIGKRVSKKWIVFGSGIVFILIGVIIALEVIL